MCKYNTVMETMQGLLPIEILEKLSKETGAGHGNEKFTAIRQLNTLLYAHLTERTGLRSIEASLLAEEKLQEYTGTISFSQLSRVNRERDPELFKAVFDEVFSELSRHNGLAKIPLNYGILKVLDSTAVRLCLRLIPWAKYSDSTGAVKIHTLYDVIIGCPDKIILTDALMHDKKKMSEFVIEPGVTYLFDRAYIDYKEFDKYCIDGIFFVSRLKKDAVFKTLNVNPVKETSSVLSDKTVILGGYGNRMENPLRLVQVKDTSNGELFYIVTNRFDLTADEISDIYRLRWSIETFFKWIKQHLIIKKFYGTSPNAILTQIYCALILYCLLKLIHILHCNKFDFLKMLRLIASGLFITLDYLIQCLTPTKPPVIRQKQPNWKNEYRVVLNEYALTDDFVK